MAGLSRDAPRLAALERLRGEFNRRDFVEPDPLQFLYRYEDPADREVAGLVASSLAYGRVAMILRSVGRALEAIPRPARDVRDAGNDRLALALRGFRHRWTTGAHVAGLLRGVRAALRRHGTLRAAFLSGVRRQDGDVVPALGAFVRLLSSEGGPGAAALLPDPGRGSACKRLLMYLRWMVRRDAVDPGGWEVVGARRLLVPLDTHMFRLCRRMGLLRRRTPDLGASREATARFRRLVPSDPVRYDFALTRLGIRGDADPAAFLEEWKGIRGERRKGGMHGDLGRGSGSGLHAGRDEGEGDPVVLQGKEGRRPVLLPPGVHPRLKQGTARL